jgi:DNA-binding transcriptional regulator YiaG
MDTLKLARALEEFKDAEGFTRLKTTRIRLDPVNVKSIREKTGLTQQSFAHDFGFSLSTLRNWEQGTREPDGSARVLLKLIENDPKYMLEGIRSLLHAA